MKTVHLSQLGRFRVTDSDVDCRIENNLWSLTLIQIVQPEKELETLYLIRQIIK